MPYKCVHCNKLIADASEEVLKGCGECGRKFFFYIRKEQAEKMKQAEQAIEVELGRMDKKQVEQDVREITGIADEETPVFLDFESVRVIKPGKYAVDLSKLFATDKPRVYKLEDGKYIIDLSTKRKPEQ